ncbi:MAG: putative methyltransferase [Planctomycetota bacterium]|jgi:predicted methyltransferase
MKNTIALVLIYTFLFSSASLYGEPYTTNTGKKIFEQLSSSTRTDEDRARDANRKPVETLEYFGLKDDMTVVELIAGSGWYTKILAPVLKDNGKLYLSVGTSRLEPNIDKFGLRDKIEIVGTVVGFEKTDMPGFIFDIASVDIGVKNVDLILTFRNLHNLNANARKVVNAAAFSALKPGGIYGVIDHTKRHMEPFSAETWRRIDPVLVIKEMLEAGFEFVDYSDMHAVADDGLVLDTTHESLNTNSDRFTLKFRKPM